VTAWDDLRFNIARFRHRHGHRPPVAPSGTVIDFDVVVPATDLTISTARVPDDTPIVVKGEIDVGTSEFDVKATIATRWEGECRRCLDLVGGEIAVEVDAAFVEGDLGDDADVYPVVDDWIDVGAVVREEVMLALPLSPLCSGDCAGADPDRFPATPRPGADEPGDSPSIDPRWAVLSELEFDED
jgi:uncharacterized protein